MSNLHVVHNVYNVSCKSYNYNNKNLLENDDARSVNWQFNYYCLLYFVNLLYTRIRSVAPFPAHLTRSAIKIRISHTLIPPYAFPFSLGKI